jgi:hypothetical protein
VWTQAVQKGRRVYSAGAIGPDAFVRCIGEVNNKALSEFGLIVDRLLRNARRIRIGSESGTDITCTMQARTPVGRIFSRISSSGLGGRALSKLKLSQASTVWPPSGMLRQGGGSTFIGGQVAFLGIAATIEGTAAIDGYLWPPEEIGKIDKPIFLVIKRGRVVDIGGCPTSARILKKWLDGKEKAIEHFCIGFNPGAQLSGELMEAERVFGCINIGLGKYPFHTDGVMKCPQMVVDDSVFMEGCAFMHHELCDLASQLRQDNISLLEMDSL